MGADPLLPDLLRHHAGIRPQVPALVSGAAPGLSYGEWLRRSEALARGLLASGVGPGDRVALIGANRAYELMGVAYVGTLLAGATVLPLASSQSQRELDAAVERGEPTLVLTCDPERPPDPAWPAAKPEQLAARAAEDVALPVLRHDEPAELLWTSGTTGTPRLVEVDHGNLASDFDGEPYAELEPHYFLHALLPGTNIGQVALRSSLTLGCTAVALDAFDVDAYIALAQRLPMHETLLVPAMAASLAAEAAHRGWELPDAVTVAVSGAAAPPATWRRLATVFPNASLINTYTTTEAWPARATTVVDPERPESVGRPLEGQAVEIRDDEGCAVAPLERGTIYLAAPATRARRYAHADVPTRVSDGGWIETDDLGYLDKDGYLYVEDRKSDVIATGGSTVSAAHVERVLSEHPLVVEAAVVGLGHAVLGEVVAAAVVGAAELEVTELERHAREQLAPHAVPRVLRRLDALPYTRSGKVQKRALRELLGSGDETTRPTSARTTDPDEALVQRIWEEVLELEGIGPDEHFLRIGGDSLSALRIVSRIREELGRGVSTAELLGAPTIAEQVAVVRASGGARS